MSENKNSITIGSATVLVNVGSTVPLVLVGVIEKLVELKIGHRNGPALICSGKHESEEVEVEGEITELEQFLVIDVTTATLPPGFPLTIAQLTASDVAVNLDYVILILPVEV